MTEELRVGDRVRVFLDEKFGENSGWHHGVIFKIDPYSAHRSFYWVELDQDAQKALNMKQISVFNPKNISKLDP